MASDKFKKHMGRPVQFSLTNENKDTDIFEFKPLNVDEFTQLMILADKFKDAESKNKVAEPSDAKGLMKLYVDIVMRSYPELKRDEAELFVVANFGAFTDLIQKLAPSTIDDNQKNALEKIKNMQKAKGITPEKVKEANKVQQ